MSRTEILLRNKDVLAGLLFLLIAAISAAAPAFVFGLERVGFPLSVFLAVFIASAASRSFHLPPCLALADGVTAAAWVIFALLLGLPFQATGSWFGL